MSEDENLTVKRYYLPCVVKTLLFFSYCVETFMGFCVVGLLIDTLRSPSFYAFFVLLMPLGLLLFFSYGTIPQWKNYLEFSPNGIICNTGSYRIYSPWENIAGITRTHVFRRSIVFLLREPAARNIPFSEGLARKQAVIERRSLLMFPLDLIQQSGNIPFLLYIPKQEWEGGEWDAYLQHYASHLLKSDSE